MTAETLSGANWGYVAAGYTLTAIVLGGYAVRLRIRRRRLRAEREAEVAR